MKPVTGRCACEGVRFEISEQLRAVFNCHCHRCRRTSGHHVAATSCNAENLRMLSDRTLRWYEPAAGVYYGFCTECGSSLFFRTDATRQRISVMAGTLDQPTGLETTQAWWVSEAADYHHRQPGLVEYPFDG